jgi:hypothetical protein
LDKHGGKVESFQFEKKSDGLIDIYDEIGKEEGEELADCCRSTLTRTRTIEPILHSSEFPVAKPNKP